MRNHLIGFGALYKKAFVGLAISLAVVCWSSYASAQPCATPTPTGFQKYAVFMANGIPTFNEAWKGYFFHKVIRGRSDAEILQNRAEAVQFYIDRFGLDPDNDSRVEMQSTYVWPDALYRAYTISGECVPSDGLTVHDGGWVMGVVDPDGITLGGEFAGVWVPTGTAFSYGEYVVFLPGKEPLIIQYQAAEPVFEDEYGKKGFRCDTFSAVYGPGIAQGVAYRSPLPDGTFQLSIRNVLTFPPLPGPPAVGQ